MKFHFKYSAIMNLKVFLLSISNDSKLSNWGYEVFTKEFCVSAGHCAPLLSVVWPSGKQASVSFLAVPRAGPGVFA